MGAREYTIYVDKPDGSGQLAIGPDDKIPTWAHDVVDARHVEGSKKSSKKDDGDGPPPRSGKGSGAEAWHEYAAAQNVDVDPDANRDEVIAALEEAGVAVDVE